MALWVLGKQLSVRPCGQHVPQTVERSTCVIATLLQVEATVNDCYRIYGSSPLAAALPLERYGDGPVHGRRESDRAGGTVWRVLGPPERTGLRERDAERVQLGRQHAIRARRGKREHALDALHLAGGGERGGECAHLRVDGAAGCAREEGDGVLERERAR
jgi:hypothetical protein